MRPRLFGVAAASAILLSGCGVVHPGAAAVVGSQTITVKQVDSLAVGLCSLNTAGGTSTTLPSRGARQGALSVLLHSAVSQQFGAREGVRAEQRQVSSALAQNASSVRELPLDQRAAFTTALRNYASGQLMVIAAGRRALEQAGKANVTDKQALATGEQMRLKFARSLHVQVDPRFGTFANGDLQSSEGSLSVAVSARAADGKTSDPSPQWLAGLPNAQKCL